MFCSNCGREITGKFCCNCGTPADVNTAPASTPVIPAEETVSPPAYEMPKYTNAYANAAMEANIPNHTNNKKALKIIIPIIAALLIVIGLAVFFIVRGSTKSKLKSPEAIISKLTTAIQNNDAATVKALCSEEIEKELSLWVGGKYTEEEVDHLEEINSTIKDRVGKIKKISYKIIDKYSCLDSLSALSLMGITINDANCYQVQLNITGTEDSWACNIYVILAKLGNKWYLIDFDS